MTYYIPDSVIAKAYKAHREAPLPGVDAMSSAINAIKSDIREIVLDQYLTDIEINKYLDGED